MDDTETAFYSYMCLAPSDAPEAFVASVLGPRSIFLQWNPPSTPNGILTNYTLRYFNSTQDMEMVLDGTATNFTVVNLNEHTGYSFQLNASTQVGYGPAAVVMATTAEDGETPGFLLHEYATVVVHTQLKFRSDVDIIQLVQKSVLLTPQPLPHPPFPSPLSPTTPPSQSLPILLHPTPVL